MKKFLILLSAVLLVLGAAGAVHALPYTDTYVVDVEQRYMRGWAFDEVEWTFDLTQEKYGPDRFNPATQDVTSASVILNLTDDSRCWDFWEVAYLDVGMNQFVWEVDTGDVSFQVSSIITLSDTGKIDASLRAIWGDFYFNSATLTAEGTLPDVGTSPIPEPAAILLFGTGLIGLTFVTRRGLYFKK